MYREGEKRRGASSSSREHADGIAEIWSSYFPETQISLDDPNLILTSHLAAFFSSPTGQHFISQIKEDGNHLYFPLDFQQFKKLCDVGEVFATLEEKPKQALSCIGAAVHKVLLSNSIWGENSLEEGLKLNVRLHNHPESMIALRNLKAAYIDRLVSVRGTVMKVSTVKPLVVAMSFDCAKCKTNIMRNFPDGKFSPPATCILLGCKSRTFTPVRSSARPIDFQRIRLQELLQSNKNEEGRVPRTVECELTEDLVDACIPGDVVTVTGIIRVINNYMDLGGGKSKGRNQGLYYLYMETISIKNSKSQSVPEDLQGTRSAELLDIYSFSPVDLKFIVKISEETDLFRQILQSLCPSIYGHELVKGVFFQLFEWNRKFAKKLLFSRKVLPPARPKQACKKFGGHEKMPMAKFLLIADENSGGFPSAMKNGVQGGDYEKTLQKNQMGAPSLVARLMGLETMPVVRQGNPKRETSYGMDELNRTSREACSLDREGKRMESRPQKLQKTGVSDRHAVTRFGADALQLKGVLTRSKKPHKQLATPVKSPRSISGRSGSRLIGAATKILEPGLQAKHRAKYTLTYSNYTRKGLHSEVMSEEKAVRYPELSKEFGHVESGPMPLNEQSSCRTCGNPLDVMEFSQNENSSCCSPQSSKCNNSELPTPYIEQQVNVVYPNEQIMHLAEAKGSPQKHLEQILDSMPPGKSPAEWQLAIQNYKPHQDASSTIASKYKAKCPKAANKERTPARSNQSDLQRKRGSPALGNSSGQKDYVTINRGLNAQARPKMHVRMDTCKQESEIRSCNTQDNSFSQPRALVRKRRPTNVGRSVSTGVTSSNSQNKKGGRCELRNGEEIQSNSGLVNRYSRKSRFARQSDDSNAAKSPGVVSFMFSSPVKHKIPSEEMEEMQRHSIQDNNFQDKRPVMDGYNGSMSSLRQIPFKGDILGAFLDQKLQELRHQKEEEVATNQPKKSSSVILQELLSVLSMEMPHSQDTLDCGNKEHSSQTTLNNEDVFQAEGKMKCISDRFPDNGCQFSPASVLEAPFSNDSCFSSSRDDSSGMRLHHGPISYFADKTVSVEPDYDLLDSATSSDKGGTGTHQMVTHLLNEIQRTIDSTGARFTGYRLNHAKQVILNTELFFQNSALQKSADDLLVQPILLDKLEALALTIFSSSTQNFEKTRDENQLKLFLVDSVVEYLDSKYVANYKLGYSTWRRFQLGLSVEMLIYEVGKEFRRWNQWTGKLTDEIIDSEMSHSLGKWTDFEIEAFEIGIEIGQDILLSLVDEVVIDLRHCMFGNF